MKYELKNNDMLPEGWMKYHKTLNGYRVNLSIKNCLFSIFDNRHNEFWMIWSEIIPVFIFLYLTVSYVSSIFFASLNDLEKCLTIAIYIAVFTSRLFSCIYHIFNCFDLHLNSVLINFDLMGICQGALGSSWFMYIYVGKINDLFLTYVSILYSNYFICLILFNILLTSKDKNLLLSNLAMNLLLLLAFIGNLPLIAIGCSNYFPFLLRLCCLSGTCTLFLGYLIYIYYIPEIFLLPGKADGKIWNSHVIWHNCVTISQVFFISAIYTT
jgi:predicted membrane channel-forming protein YqfA (hemolysin III family)